MIALDVAFCAIWGAEGDELAVAHPLGCHAALGENVLVQHGIRSYQCPKHNTVRGWLLALAACVHRAGSSLLVKRDLQQLTCLEYIQQGTAF
jgi:hypothetical protein